MHATASSATETSAAGDDSLAWGAWMADAQRGDRVAYHALLRDITPYLRSLARRFLGQDPDVEDVVQEILILVHGIRHTYEPDRPFKPWLRTIAARRCLDQLRRRRRRLQHESGSADELEVAPDDAPSPEQALQRRQERQRLAGAVDELPVRQREAIRLLRLGELSLAEAAAESEQSIGSLKVAVHRALKSLQRKLSGREHPDD